MDGNIRSIKVYVLLAYSIATFSFLWFEKIDQSTLLAMQMPTMVAWLAAHVTQQVAKMRNGNG